MAASDPASVPEPDWPRTVTVREDPELALQIASRLPARGAPRSISVTDLLAPRPAYWRAQGPPPPTSVEREERLDQGRRTHRELGVLLAGSGELEVRVRRDGVHGRIDILTDRPIEVKTSTAALPSADLLRSRPEHVDQLAIYCALLDRDEGRLIYVRSEPGQPRASAIYDLSFRSLAGLRGEMVAQATALREALRDRRSAGLPRCAWFGRGCEWQAAGICDCAGSDPENVPLSTGHVGEVTPREDLARPLERTLAEQVPGSSPSGVEMFRDLIYLRRAFFRQALPGPTNPPSPTGRSTEVDMYRRLSEAVESGPAGEVARLVTRSEEPEEEVGGFRGAPYLVRTSRAKSRIPASEWLTRSPQYALDLGFRCVATGRRTGRIVLGYEFAADDPGAIQVLEMTFDAPTTFSRLWRTRSQRLARALTTHDPGLLPACPGWMYSGCDYRDVCGCGTPSGRPQWKMTVDAVRKNPSDS